MPAKRIMPGDLVTYVGDRPGIGAPSTVLEVLPGRDLDGPFASVLPYPEGWTARLANGHVAMVVNLRLERALADLDACEIYEDALRQITRAPSMDTAHELAEQALRLGKEAKDQ